MADSIPAGWDESITSSNFVNLIGPIYRQVDKDGNVRYGMQIGDKHLNKRDVAHGGLLMSFMDNVLGRTIRDASGETDIKTATIELDNKFIGSVRDGDFLIARGEVVRRTRSLVFLQGTLSVDDNLVFSSSGVWKILGQ